MANEQKHSRYLKDPEFGHVELVPASEVEAKRSVGWSDPQGVRANGIPYNLDEHQSVTDAAGEMLQMRRDAQELKAKDEEHREEREAIHHEPPPLPQHSDNEE